MQHKKIGFFGGTFDPVHFGHLSLVLHMLETQGLDEIFICPARFSPHKDEESPVSPTHRWKMLELAFQPLKGFKLLDLEIKREGPSYTIDTIRELKKEYPSSEFNLILAEDILAGLTRWKEVEILLKMAPPLIGTRLCDVKDLKFPETLKQIIEKGAVPSPAMEISSTDIRQRLRQGKYCGHLVPLKVLDYIASNHVYY